jgi:voltage-gated sodium channel
VGLQTYSDLDFSDSSNVLSILDLSTFGFFVIELLVRMIAERRLLLFFSTKNADVGWNWFDFAVVVLSAPVDQADIGAIKTFRMVRLLRLFRLFGKVKQLQTIVMGLVGGLRSIVYILLLLSVIFYVYAVLGVTYFRENDPEHFGHLGIAMITLFRVCTLEDWTDLMYLNKDGCHAEGPNRMSSFCNEAKARGYSYWAVLYFVSFVILASFVVLSLFVAVITMSMQESVVQIQEERDKIRQLKIIRDASAQKKGHKGDSIVKRRITRAMTATYNRTREVESLQQNVEATAAAQTLGGGGHESATFKNPFKGRPPEPRTVRTWYGGLTSWCNNFVESPCFRNGISLVVAFSCVLVGLQLNVSADVEEDAFKFAAYQHLERVVLTLYTLEVVLKVVAEGEEPWEYWFEFTPVNVWGDRKILMPVLNKWNIFDFSIVVLSFLQGGTNANPTTFRVVRVLRVFRLLHFLPQVPPPSLSFFCCCMFRLFFFFSVFEKSPPPPPLFFSFLRRAVLPSFLPFLCLLSFLPFLYLLSFLPSSFFPSFTFLPSFAFPFFPSPPFSCN